jgi:uncharacterized protein (TIGR02996 family)
MDHPDWAAFVEAIVANPGDDTARLVAADFLEENGDADRAAFIRVQVELARLESIGVMKGPDVEQLRAKERGFTGSFSNLSLWAAEECSELVKMRGGGREAMTVEGAEQLRWYRGFIHQVRCLAREWQQHGATIRKRLPIRIVTLRSCEELTAPDWLGMLPSLQGLSELRYQGWCRLGDLRQRLPGVSVTGLDFGSMHPPFTPPGPPHDE